MTVLVALTAAVGLLLFFSGFPAFDRHRLARRIEPYVSGLHGRPSNLLTPPSASQSTLTANISMVLHRILPSSDEDIVRRLQAAGDNRNPASFRLEQFTWGVAAMLASWTTVAAARAAAVMVDLRILPLLTAIAFASGFLGRDWWLGRAIENRRAALEEELPTAIDLVTLSIMSGESVPAAFARIAELLEVGIGAEFGRAVADVRAGSPVVEALESMKRRLPAWSVARFVDALSTGIERGAPLADVLRAQADDGREARRRFLLEAGGRREVLMLVPVVFLIMPVVVLFALLPGLVSLDLLVP